jgi:hypothetical protein
VSVYIILLYMCPHIYVAMWVRILLYMCPRTTVCVLVLLYMCPHTTTCVSSYYYICVLMLPKPDGEVRGYISSVRMLLYMCPHTTICVRILLYVYVRILFYACSCYYVGCIILPDLEVSGSGEEALAAPSASVFVLLYQ